MNLVGRGTLCQGIQALIVKRLQIYKRDVSSYICELVVPIVLVLAGVMMTIGTSGVPIAEPRPIVPQNYPGPQRILLNENLIASNPGNISPQDLFSSLPDQGSQFEVTYSNKTDGISDYYTDVFDQINVGEEMPYRFGSYSIY